MWGWGKEPTKAHGFGALLTVLVALLNPGRHKKLGFRTELIDFTGAPSSLLESVTVAPAKCLGEMEHEGIQANKQPLPSR